MKLITQPQRKKLVSNFEVNLQQRMNGGDTLDNVPVVKLFTPDAGATWLLSELDPDSNEAFGLCDLGLGSPELGYVSLDELAETRGPFGLPIERDRSFKASRFLNDYASQARDYGRIVA